MFAKVAIVGPGLIGGSMGLAMRRRALAERVVGIGRRQESIDRALHAEAIDEGTLEPAVGVRDAELVVLATPIGALAKIASQIAEHLAPGAVISDVASAKAGVIRTITENLGHRPDVSYIPSHPMAGSEQSGPLAAREDLFDGSVCILTPLANSKPSAENAVRHLWQALGARVVSMSPQAHDRLVARISHMPHLVAASVLTCLQEGELGYCGGGLRDTTRIAAGSPDMWVDICRENRKEVLDALESLVKELNRMCAALREDRPERLRQLLQDAREKRRSMPDSR